jgi:hypothetical protein
MDIQLIIHRILLNIVPIGWGICFDFQILFNAEFSSSHYNKSTTRVTEDKMHLIGVKIIGRNGDDSDFVKFKLEDVNYINMHKPDNSSVRIPIYHTSHGSFAPLMTLKDISAAMKTYGFAHFDKSTIVNLKRIKDKIKGRKGLRIVFVDYCEIRVSPRSRIK